MRKKTLSFFVISFFALSISCTVFWQISLTADAAAYRRLDQIDLLNNPPKNDVKLIVSTGFGDVVINNVFKGYLATNGDYFTFWGDQSTGQVLNYEPNGPDGNAFVISGVSEGNQTAFETDREKLEQVLTAQLGITESDACKLNAFTRTIGTYDASWENKKWPLSFCNGNPVGSISPTPSRVIFSISPSVAPVTPSSSNLGLVAIIILILLIIAGLVVWFIIRNRRKKASEISINLPQ